MEKYLKDSPSDWNATSTNSNSSSDIPGGNDYSLNLSTYNAPQTNSYQSNTTVKNEYLSPNLESQLASSAHSDPFLDDLESLTFPEQQHQQPVQFPQQLSFGGAENDNQFINPQQSTTTNLDELISPDVPVSFNNANDTSFLNPQYFSPPNNASGFQNLNSIAEDSLSNSFNNNFSPNMAHRGSISVNPPNNNYPDINSGSYLSPSANSQFMSPSHHSNYDNSFDTLRSPSGSYLNSPPANYGIPSNQLSSSIPNHSSHHASLLSPPPSGHLGTSVPAGNSPASSSSPGVSTKLLTKEEKLKRRREFHNAVERRRRDLIKERIKDLGMLVPPSLLNPQLTAVQTLQKNSDLNSREINDLLSAIKVKETKPNKSTILNKSVDYINHLRYVEEEQDKARALLLKQIEELEAELGGVSFDDSNLNKNQGFGDPQLDALATSTEPLNQGQPDSYFNPDEFFSDIVGHEDHASNY